MPAPSDTSVVTSARRVAMDRLLGQGSSGSEVLLVGEAGIGKTHLLKALSEHAGELQMPVLAARGAEIDCELPLGVVADLLGLDATGADLAAAVRADLGLDATAGPRELAAALALRLAPSTIVVVDDAHWADPASLVTLRHLARRPPAGLRVVLAARAAGGLPAGAVGDDIDLVTLEPLTEGEARAMAPDLDLDQVDRLRRASGGNGLLLGELIRAEREGRRPSATTVAPLVERRLDGLTPDGRALLEAAAAAGDPCPAGLAEDASGLAPEAVDAAWDELQRAALVQPAEDADRLAFRHPVVRAVVHQGIPGSRRRALHARLLAALRARGAAPAVLAPHVLEVAEAGDDQAIDALVAAAYSVRADVPAAAVRWLRAALGLCRGPSQERAGEVAHALAKILLEAGDPEACMSVIARMPAARGRAETPLLVLESRAARSTGRVAGMSARLRSALERELDPALAMRLRAELSALTLEIELDFPAAIEFGSVPDGDPGVDAAPAAAGTALAYAAAGLCCLERRPEAARLAERAMALIEREEDAAERAEAQGWLAGFRFYGAGLPAAGAADYDRAHSNARAAGTERAAVPLLARASQAHTTAGAIDRALELAERAEDLAHEAALDHGVIQAVLARCWAEIWAGRVDVAVRLARRHASEVGASPVLAVPMVWSWMTGQAYAAAGRPEVAIAQITRALGPALEATEPLGGAFAKEILVRARVAQGDLEQARNDVDLRPPPEDFLLARSLDALARAHIARADHELDALRTHGAQCTRLADAAGAALVAARGDLAVAAGLAEAGHEEEAARRRRQAEAHGWAVGLRVSTWPDDLPAGGAAAARSVLERERRVDSPALDSLTPRQREVAVLLAQGRTNGEIAEALALSVFTVADHVSAVLHRLGVARRSAVGRAIGFGTGRPAADPA